MKRKLAILSVIVLIVGAFAGCIRDDSGSAQSPQGGGDPDNGVPSNQNEQHFMEDPEVRQALSFAFPYAQAREQVFHGYMLPLAGPIPQGMPYHETQTQIYEENLNQATEILDAAGYTVENGARFDGEPIRIFYNAGNTQREQAAQLFRQNLGLIQINAEVQALPWPQLLERMFETREWDVIFLAWSPDYNDPDNYWFPFAASGKIEGFPNLKADVFNTGYSNAQLDELLLEAKFETDEARRADLYAQAHEIYMQEPSLIFMGQSQSVSTYREWVNGLTYNPMVIEPGYFHDLSKAQGSKNPERFVYGTFGEPATLDPHDAYDSASGLAIQNVYDTLVRYEGTDTQSVAPRLAESWDSEENGRVWTFHLRDDVRFADGTPLTAEDVEYSFKRILRLGAPDTGVHWIISQYLSEDGVEAVDEHTVRFTLTQTYGGFLPTLAYTVGSVISKDYCEAHGGMPQPADEVEEGDERDLGCADHLRENPMGTNAWTVERWDRENELVLVPNAHYWEGWDGDHVDRVILRMLEEPSTRINALRDGTIDYSVVDLDKLDEVRGQPGVVVKEGDSFNVQVAVMQTRPESS